MLKEQVYNKELKLMGKRFKFSSVSENEPEAHQCISHGIDEVKRIEKLLTTFDGGS